MLQGWLIYSKEDAQRNAFFIKMHRERGEKLGMELVLHYAEEISTTVEQGGFRLYVQGKRAQTPDFVLCRTRDYLLSRQLELMNIPVFNNSEVSLVGNNKALAYQEAAACSIPVVDTCFCKNKLLPQSLAGLLAGKDGSLEKPVVVKSLSGHGGSQVFLYQNQRQLGEILEGIGQEDTVIQPLIAGPGEDIRVYLVGNKIRGCVGRRARGGFKSNFSLGGDIFPCQLSKEEEKLVERLLQRWHFDFAGIDFIRREDGQLLFNEIEDVVGSRMYYQCYEDDILLYYLSYVKERLEK